VPEVNRIKNKTPSLTVVGMRFQWILPISIEIVEVEIFRLRNPLARIEFLHGERMLERLGERMCGRIAEILPHPRPIPHSQSWSLNMYSNLKATRCPLFWSVFDSHSISMFDCATVKRADNRCVLAPRRQERLGLELEVMEPLIVRKDDNAIMTESHGHPGISEAGEEAESGITNVGRNAYSPGWLRAEGISSPGP
jgi:hypothetical protein